MKNDYCSNAPIGRRYCRPTFLQWAALLSTLQTYFGSAVRRWYPVEVLSGHQNLCAVPLQTVVLLRQRQWKEDNRQAARVLKASDKMSLPI